MTELLPLPHFHSGKVRDTYEIPGFPEYLLMVASDRISTHNVKHLSLIPSKGALLNAQTIYWWQAHLADLKTHIAFFGKAIYDPLPEGEYPSDLHHRAVVVHRRTPDLREFIWRDYLAGSLLEAYRRGEDPYELALAHGLPKMHRFRTALFTPTRKSEKDEPVRPRFVRRNYPLGTELTKTVFHRMSQHLESRGITLIDGKFEVSGDMLIDEWGTGDCCRMAWTRDVQEGEEPPWLDKEYFRQAAVRAWGEGPRMPVAFTPHDIEQGVRRYHEAFEAITQMSLGDFQDRYLD